MDELDCDGETGMMDVVLVLVLVAAVAWAEWVDGEFD